MGFTKAQRLKGLKKQLGNLGYDVVSRGTGTGSPEPETGGEVDLAPASSFDSEDTAVERKALGLPPLDDEYDSEGF